MLKNHDNNQKMSIQQRVGVVAREILTIFLRRVVTAVAVLVALIGLSFFFFGEFSYSALSERLVWAGLGIAIIGGALIFGQTTGGRNYGVSGLFTRTVHANDLINFNIEVRKNLQGKFDFTIQLFLIGLLLFLLGVLVDSLLV